MNKLVVCLSLITLLAMATAVNAVSYPFPNHGTSCMACETVIKAGAKVYLFHSGTDSVKDAIRVNDVLSVYRGYPPDFSPGSTEAGKVRILVPLGDYYFEGEVVEGEMQPGYLAKKGTVACYITPFARIVQK
jgi:hypothetical protein